MNVFSDLGDARSLRTAIDVFYRRVLDDPVTSPYFEGVDLARLSAHQRAFLAMALGGPDVYTGRHLASAHDGLGIDDEAYDVLVEHLLSTLRDFDAPPDLLSRLVDRIEELRTLVVTPVAAPSRAPDGR